MHKVVAHYQSGQVIKGIARDFTPSKERFRLQAEDGQLLDISLGDLKGLFFVKNLEGDLGHAKSNLFDLKDMSPGRKIRVEFKDGETLQGITQGYQPGRAGFFVVPADRKSNTERAYINTSAAADITFI